MKRKKSDRKKHIQNADNWFSRRVRLEASDSKGMGRCFDCGTPVEVKYADCGHFFSRSHLATRWDLDNARLQKKKCNLEMGRPDINHNYRTKLIKELGPERFEKLHLRHFNISKMQNFEIELIANEHKGEVKKLLKDKNLKAWW